MAGPFKRCKENGNGYFHKGRFIRLKPNQRRFENTTLTKTYGKHFICPLCGFRHRFPRDTSQLGRCEGCGTAFVVTIFKEIPRTPCECAQIQGDGIAAGG